MGQPWAARAMGGAPWLWVEAVLAGAASIWLTLNVPGDITGGMEAGLLSHLAWAVLMGVLPLIAIVDARTLLIPNRILFPAAGAIGVLLVADLLVGSMSGWTALSALAGGLILSVYAFTIWFIAPERGYGWGDVKLTALCGLVLGTQSIWTAVVALAIIPPLLALVPMLAVTARASRQAADPHVDPEVPGPSQIGLPFGPFLVLGVVLATFLVPVYLSSPI